MSAPPKQIYWDSCAWIGLLNAEKDKVTPLRAIWEDAQKGKFQIWTSAYSYLEIIHTRVLHGEAYPPEKDDQEIEEKLAQPFVNRVQLDVPVGRLARSLKRQLHNKGLQKRSDAIHLATAAHYNLEELHTWDGAHLLQFDGAITCRNGTILKVRQPGADYVNGPLFAVAGMPSATMIGAIPHVEIGATSAGGPNVEDEDPE